MDKAILKVNKRSKPIAGIGKIIIANNRTIMAGPATVLLLRFLKESKNCVKFMMQAQVAWC
jgi:hypothetical protein